MSGTCRAGSYRALLSRPHVRRTFALALVGRLAYGVLPLILLFTARQTTGSFTVAAGAMAAFGLAALAMPVQARLLDRLGQRRVLPTVLAAFLCLLAVGVVLATGGVAAPAGWLVLGFALGLTAPALGPSTRAQWRHFTDGTDLTATAYALDGSCEESLYLIGPIIASAILAAGPAWIGLPVVGLLLLVGVTGLVGSPAAGVVAGPAAGGWLSTGPLRNRRLWFLLLAMAGAGMALATLYTGLAARSNALGHPEYAGWVEAALAAGSVTGGLIWGRLRPVGRWPAHLAGLFAVLALGLAVSSTVGPLVFVAGVLAGSAVATAPTYIVAYGAVDQLVSPGERTEASTWVNTVTNLGMSAGGALSGVLIDRSGPSAPFVLGAVVLAVLALALALSATVAAADPAISPTSSGGASV